MEVEKPVVIIPQKGNTLYSKCVQASRDTTEGAYYYLWPVQLRSFTQKVSRCHDTDVTVTQRIGRREPTSSSQKRLPVYGTGFLKVKSSRYACVGSYVDHVEYS